MTNPTQIVIGAVLLLSLAFSVNEGSSGAPSGAGTRGLSASDRLTPVLQKLSAASACKHGSVCAAAGPRQKNEEVAQRPGTGSGVAHYIP